MFNVETGRKSVEHRTATVQQRFIIWGAIGLFVSGFALCEWSTSTANAAASTHAPVTTTSTTSK